MLLEVRDEETDFLVPPRHAAALASVMGACAFLGAKAGRSAQRRRLRDRSGARSPEVEELAPLREESPKGSPK